MFFKKILTAAAILISSSFLSASSVLELMGAFDSPNAFTARIISTGAEAAYFNPAYIVMQEDSFKLGFGMMIQSKTIKIGRASCWARV